MGIIKYIKENDKIYELYVVNENGRNAPWLQTFPIISSSNVTSTAFIDHMTKDRKDTAINIAMEYVSPLVMAPEKIENINMLAIIIIVENWEIAVPIFVKLFIIVYCGNNYLIIYS